jgi:hypothetical protein
VGEQNLELGHIRRRFAKPNRPGPRFQRAFVCPRNGSFLTRRWREMDSNPRSFTRIPAFLRLSEPRSQPICTPIMLYFAPLARDPLPLVSMGNPELAGTRERWPRRSAHVPPHRGSKGYSLTNHLSLSATTPTGID